MPDPSEHADAGRTSASQPYNLAWADGLGDAEMVDQIELDLEAEADALAPKDAERARTSTHARSGYVQRPVDVNGRRLKLRVPRLRARSLEQSLGGKSVWESPPYFSWLKAEAERQREQDIIDLHTEGVSAAGVESLRTKRMARQEQDRQSATVPGRRKLQGWSRNAVWTRTKKIMNRSLTTLRQGEVKGGLVAGVILDGVKIRGKTALVVVGIMDDGKRVRLGSGEAQEETTELVSGTLKTIARGGVNLNYAVFIVDGGDKLRFGIAEAGYPDAQIQTCISHLSRLLREKKGIPKIEYDGVNTRVASAAKESDSKKRLNSLRKVRRDCEAAGLKKAVKELDKRIDATQGKTRGSRAADPTAGLDEALRKVVPKDVWEGWHSRLFDAWNIADYDDARAALVAIEQALGAKGYVAAAKSLHDGMEESLTVNRLRVDDLDLRRTVRTNGALESFNARLRKAEREHPTRSRPESGARLVAQTLEVASQTWNPIDAGDGLRQMTLEVLKARHPDVDVNLSLGPTGLTVSEICVPAELQREGRADAVMSDLVEWSDLAGLPLGATPRAMAPGADAKDLKRWLSRHGFVASAGLDLDPAFSETMVRFPEGPAQKVELASAKEGAAATDVEPDANGESTGDDEAAPVVSPAPGGVGAEPEAVGMVESNAAAEVEPKPTAEVEPDAAAEVEPEAAVTSPEPVVEDVKPEVAADVERDSPTDVRIDATSPQPATASIDPAAAAAAAALAPASVVAGAPEPPVVSERPRRLEDYRTVLGRRAVELDRRVAASRSLASLDPEARQRVRAAARDPFARLDRIERRGWDRRLLHASRRVAVASMAHQIASREAGAPARLPTPEQMLSEYRHDLHENYRAEVAEARWRELQEQARAVYRDSTAKQRNWTQAQRERWVQDRVSELARVYPSPSGDLEREVDSWMAAYADAAARATVLDGAERDAPIGAEREPPGNRELTREAAAQEVSVQESFAQRRWLFGEERAARIDKELAAARAALNERRTDLDRLRLRREELGNPLEHFHAPGAVKTLERERERRQMVESLRANDERAAEARRSANSITAPWRFQDRRQEEARAQRLGEEADTRREEIARFDEREQRATTDRRHPEYFLEKHRQNLGEALAIEEVLERDGPTIEHEPEREQHELDFVLPTQGRSRTSVGIEAF